MKKVLSCFLLLSLMMSIATGCKHSSGTGEGESDPATVQENFATSPSEMFTDRDYDASYEEEESVHITLQGDTATADSDAVQINGSTVTITEEATYILSGTLQDGMIFINAEDQAKIQLVLDGVEITNLDSAPIYILKGDKVFITLAPNSNNTLSNGGSFTAINDNNIDAAVFSKQDLTFNGSGSLTVNSPAGHGIVSKDDLVFTDGTYTIHSASHGLDANDSIRVTNASITVNAGKDGIHAENNDDTSLGFVYFANGTFHIEAEGDGVSAGSYLQIEDGTYQILAGGGSENAEQKTSDSWGGFMGDGMENGMGGGMPGGDKGKPGMGNAPMSPQTSIPEFTDTTDPADDSSTSMKGLKADGGILIHDGTFSINSADDGVHSNTSITVNGGSFEVATGDDGFHADETLTITTGQITVTESYEGLEALHITISGGEINLTATDDGINAAGGTDSSGFGGFRQEDAFGGGPGEPGEMGGPGDQNGSSNGSILISGGNITVYASGDGIDANGSLTISGGYTAICGPTVGDTATLDYDTTGTITGGTFIGTGASGMAQTFSEAEQGVIALNVKNQSAGTEISFADAQGNVLITHTPQSDFDFLIFSCPEMKTGESYQVTVGSDTRSFEAQ